MQAAVQPDDRELLQAFARGGGGGESQGAFGALVERHAPWVFAAAYRQLRDHQMAEDATQAVFLLLSQRAQTMGSNQKLSGWLFNAVQYTVRTLRRARLNRQKHELQAALERSLGSSGAAPAGESGPPMAEALDAAVGRLSGSDRTAIVLRFYQNLEVGDLAVALNISEAAARKRLTRAIARLREHLGGEVSAATLAVAAAAGVNSFPAHLTQTIYQAATHVGAGSAASTTAVLAAKGVSHMMFVAKVKVASIAVSAVILAGAATGLTLQTLAQTPAPPAPAARTGGDSPAATPAVDGELATFQRIYALKPGVVLRRIVPPFPKSRIAFFQANSGRKGGSSGTVPNNSSNVAGTAPDGIGMGTGGGRVVTRGGGGTGGVVSRTGGGSGIISWNGTTMPAGAMTGTLNVPAGAAPPSSPPSAPSPPDAMILGSEDGVLRIHGSYTIIGENPGAAVGDQGMTVAQLLWNLLPIQQEEIEGDAVLLKTRIPGDFVVRSGATLEQIRVALEQVLSDEFDPGVTLTYRDVARKVMVMRGKWNYHPAEAKDADAVMIELSAPGTYTPTGNGMARGSPSAGFFKALGQWIGTPVVSEAEGVPEKLSWRDTEDFGRGVTRADSVAHNPALVLKHIQEQTGLTATEETRQVRHLFVERVK